MRIDRYDPTDMSLLASDVTGVDFGNVVRGGYTSSPIAIKPVATVESSVSQLFFFLEDNADLTGSTFRVLKSSVAIPGIGSGSALLTGELTEIPGVSDFTDYSTITGDGVVMTSADPEYLWTDVRIGASETVGAGTINYRFIFEYV